MNWDQRIINQVGPIETLKRIENLFRLQMSSWPLLREGVENLRRCRVKQLDIRWFHVLVRHIPHRILSTTAKVDHQSIQKRPCFLCPDNLPEEEKGVEFGNDFIILCNPYPILDKHLSIVKKQHVSQEIVREFSTMLDLAIELPGFMILYNGPECGASAPDHLHFQACSTEMVPTVRDVERMENLIIEDYARQVLVLRERDRGLISDRFSEAMSLLEEVNSGGLEPMVNVVVLWDALEWVVLVFPRRKHRPTAFYEGKLTFSPASIDLCGVPVLPIESDFEEVDSAAIEEAFVEITISKPVFGEIVNRLRSTK